MPNPIAATLGAAPRRDVDVRFATARVADAGLLLVLVLELVALSIAFDTWRLDEVPSVWAQVVARSPDLLRLALAIGAAMLALLMIPATITQWISGEPGVFVPLVLLVLLLLVAWRRNPAAVRAGYDAAVRTPRPLMREGVIAGVIGATVIAVWFFFVDIIASHALFTPTTLGRGLLSIFGPVPSGQSDVTLVIIYTLFHYAAFILIGLVSIFAYFVLVATVFGIGPFFGPRGKHAC